MCKTLLAFPEVRARLQRAFGNQIDGLMFLKERVLLPPASQIMLLQLQQAMNETLRKR